MEELVKFTLLLRDRQGYLVDRNSERKQSTDELMNVLTSAPSVNFSTCSNTHILLARAQFSGQWIFTRPQA